MKRYDSTDLASPVTYAADTELKNLAVFTANMNFDKIAAGKMGRAEFKNRVLAGEYPDLMLSAVNAAVDQSLAAEAALAAALAVVSTIAPPAGYALTVEDKFIVLNGQFNEDLHARIKRACGEWDGKAGANRRVWLIPVAKASSLKRIFGNSAKAAEKAAAERKAAEKARAEKRAAEEKIREVAAAAAKAAREAQWAEERKARAAAPKKLRALFPCAALPNMELPVRFWNSVVVFTGVGQTFIINDDAPSLHGSHLLGHEGSYGRYCYYRLADAAEIAALEQSEAADRDRVAAEQARIAGLESIKKQIIADGERPTATELPRGFAVSLVKKDFYGTGEWFVVIHYESIWFIQGNGMDGDDWSKNNLPGCIGWRVPYAAELAKKLEDHVSTKT